DPRPGVDRRGHEAAGEVGLVVGMRKDAEHGAQAGRHLGDRPGTGGGGHGRTSSTRLNGVLTASRTRVKPAAPSTSASRSGPAWAPRLWPPGWARALGVHRNVDPA